MYTHMRHVTHTPWQPHSHVPAVPYISSRYSFICDVTHSYVTEFIHMGHVTNTPTWPPCRILLTHTHAHIQKHTHTHTHTHKKAPGSNLRGIIAEKKNMCDMSHSYT